MFYKLRNAIFPLNTALERRAQDVIAMRHKPREIGGGVWGDFQDVPDIRREEERGPLEGEPEGRGDGVPGKGDKDIAEPLALVRSRRG